MGADGALPRQDLQSRRGLTMDSTSSTIHYSAVELNDSETLKKEICGKSATSASTRPAGRPDLRCRNPFKSLASEGMEADFGIADPLHHVKLGDADGSGWNADFSHLLTRLYLDYLTKETLKKEICVQSAPICVN